MRLLEDVFTGMGNEGAFWGAEKVLYLDRSEWWIHHQATYLGCVHVAVNDNLVKSK